MGFVCVFLSFFFIAGLPGNFPFPAGSAVAAEKGTGLPLPRFVSLRSGEVNLRAGPGVQYPVDWVFTRQNLPVEIIAEYDTWRKVRDWQGTDGWVHQSMLGSRRTVIITNKTRTLRKSPNPDAPPIAHLEENVIGLLLKCPDGIAWCQVEVDGYKGWMKRIEFWGIHRNEAIE
ncbi:MAG: SH3 domain-containing protein [Rhodospirillales bacterium]|nr:SH3 domain-containing protein [Rhodospirillales bacterium]